MQELLDRLVNAALNRQEPDRGDASLLLRSSDDDFQAVVAAAYQIRRAFFGKRVKLNFLLNMKSGLCPEDCHYCSQRRDSTADILKYPMVDADAAVEAAGRAVGAGAKRLCMVASGRGPTDHELDQVTANVRAVKSSYPNLEICACLGLLADGQADALKDAGVYAYNHNLNTSEKQYDRILRHPHLRGPRGHRRAGHRSRAVRLLRRAIRHGRGRRGHGRPGHRSAAPRARLGADQLPDPYRRHAAGRQVRADAAEVPAHPGAVPLHPDVEVRIAGGREVHLRSLQPLQG